jgi:hypothetical protein
MPSGLNGLECLLDFSRGTRVFSWNPHLSTKAAFFKIMFHCVFIMFIDFSLFDDVFHWFFNYVSLAFHYFEDVAHYFSMIFHYFQDGFNYVALIVQCVYMCFIIFHWFFNVLKIFFIMFHYMLGCFLLFTCIFCIFVVHGRHGTVQNSKFWSFGVFRTK